MTERVQIRRVYEAPDADDGYRVLVDRLWPRGVSKDKADVDEWLRDVSPSDELRHWFGHDPDLWSEFQRRYRVELEGVGAESMDHLVALASEQKVTLVYAARDTEHNNAVAIKELLDERLATG